MGWCCEGKRLFVIQNYANQLSVVRLSNDWLSGSITGVATQSDFAFDIPTTAASFGDALYVVNGRFEASPPLTAGSPDIEYALLRVLKSVIGNQ